MTCHICHLNAAETTDVRCWICVRLGRQAGVSVMRDVHEADMYAQSVVGNMFDEAKEKGYM